MQVESGAMQQWSSKTTGDGRPRPSITGSSGYFSLFIHKFFLTLIAAHKLKRIRNRRHTLFHARNHVGTSKPVCFCQIGDRPLRWMIRMRVIEANDILAALATFALNANELFRIDMVAVLRRILTCIVDEGQDSQIG
jgi:hypothetical protein